MRCAGSAIGSLTTTTKSERPIRTLSGRSTELVFEELLLDTRYSLPDQQDTNSFVITKDIVIERLTHEGRSKQKKGPRKTA